MLRMLFLELGGIAASSPRVKESVVESARLTRKSENRVEDVYPVSRPVGDTTSLQVLHAASARANERLDNDETTILTVRPNPNVACGVSLDPRCFNVFVARGRMRDGDESTGVDPPARRE